MQRILIQEAQTLKIIMSSTSSCILMISNIMKSEERVYKINRNPSKGHKKETNIIRLSFQFH